MYAKKLNLDATDKAILSCLLSDTRASIADIARAVKVQRDTVQYRIERMEKRGLILKYHTIVDPSTLGYDVFMLVLLKIAPVEKARIDTFVAALKQHPSVTHLTRLVGRYDYMIQIAAPDIMAFDQVLDEIKSIEPGLIIETDISSMIDEQIDDFSGLIQAA